MAFPDFGTLKRLDPRLHWPHEGLNFTPWLASHIDQLGNALGIDLELRSREAAVGSFSLDLLAHDVGQDRVAIIENQLEATDHDHLGKLITYAAGFDAAVVIWICREIREEHRQALDWLNLHTDEKTEFFGVVIEVFQIDGSRPAFNFNPVVFPNDWQKTNKSPSVGATSERSEKYRSFFQALIDELRTTYQFTNAKVGQPQNWYSFSSGTSGILYSGAFAQQGPSVQLYIDRDDVTLNKSIFDQLLQQRSAIENAVGAQLSWERLESRRACRVALYREGSIMGSSEECSAIHRWMIEHLLKFKSAFAPHLQSVTA